MTPCMVMAAAGKMACAQALSHLMNVGKRMSEIRSFSTPSAISHPYAPACIIHTLVHAPRSAGTKAIAWVCRRSLLHARLATL